MKPHLTPSRVLRRLADTAFPAGAASGPVATVATVTLPATMAAPFAQLRTRGARCLIAGTVAGVAGGALVAGGYYGLAGAGHVLPTTLTAVDLPAGVNALRQGAGDLAGLVEMGWDTLAALGGTLLRGVATITALATLGRGLYTLLVGTDEDGKGRRNGGPDSVLLSLLTSAALMMAAWAGPHLIAAMTGNDGSGIGLGSGSTGRVIAAIKSGAFEPSMVEAGSDQPGAIAYLMAQRDQWQLQRPRNDTTQARDAAYLASLRERLASLPPDAPADPAIRYVMERSAFGEARSAVAKAYVVQTQAAYARAQRRGRIALPVGAGILLVAIGLGGLGGAITARVRRVQAWLPAPSEGRTADNTSGKAAGKSDMGAR